MKLKKIPDKQTYHVPDYAYLTSSIGNAYFSGMTLEELWQCVTMGENAAEIDAAVDAKAKLDNIVKRKVK